ncbi:MAG: zinc-binding dehydrogenase [Anaerolineae bacterium]
MERARELGAAEVFNYREEDWVSRVLEVTDGQGVDLVQDNVGAATWPSGLRVLARNGRLITCGSHSGAEVELEIGQIYHLLCEPFVASPEPCYTLRKRLSDYTEAGSKDPL